MRIYVHYSACGHMRQEAAGGVVGDGVGPVHARDQGAGSASRGAIGTRAGLTATASPAHRPHPPEPVDREAANA